MSTSALVLSAFLAIATDEHCQWTIPNDLGVRTISSLDLERILLNDSVYDKSVRPLAALDDSLGAPPDHMFLKLSLNSFEIDESSQALNIRGMVLVRWHDWRLEHIAPSGESCDPDRADARWVLSVDGTESIWRPRIYAANSRQRFVHRGWEGVYATWLNASGWLVRAELIDVVVDCQVRAKTLPLDEHICTVKLRSWDHTADDLVIRPEAQYGRPVDSDGVQDNLIWYLTHTSAKQTTLRDDDGSVYSGVELKLHVERRRAYHLQFSMIPAVLFLLVAYNGFFINREVAPARVTIAVIPILIMRLLLNNIYIQIETVSYQLYLAQFLNIAMYITCFCVFEYSAVQLLLQKEKAASGRRKALQVMGARLNKQQQTQDAKSRPTLVTNLETVLNDAATARDSKDTGDPSEDSNHEADGSTTRPEASSATEANYKDHHQAFSTNFEDAIKRQQSRPEDRPMHRHKPRRAVGDAVASVLSHASQRVPHAPANYIVSASSMFRHIHSHRDSRQSEEKDGNGSDEFFPESLNPVFDRDIALLKELFDNFDNDRSGLIESSEVANVLRHYGVYVSTDVARFTVINYYFFNQMPIPKKREVHLTFVQFVDFITRYDEYALGHDSADKFTAMPQSLQLDVVCRWGFIPACVAIFAIHYLAWFAP